MRILTDKETLVDKANGKYIYPDNDFLGQLYEHEEVFEDFIGFLPDAALIIDPFIELEFRRDVFLPEQKDLKEKFINNPLFLPASDHQSQYMKVKTNALLLSQIYAHQSQHGASLSDLFLAGRLMLNPEAGFIITGNRKDFPSCIFNNGAILNLESDNGTSQPFYLIEFDIKKFDECYAILEKLGGRKLKNK